MKIQAVGLLVFILQQSATSIPQQASAKGSIEGSVVRMGTGEPIAGARVTVGITIRQQRTAISNQSGKYIINGLDAGAYLMTVTADGYAHQEYGQQRSFSGRGDRLILAPGEALKSVDFVMIPTGYVSGRIRDKVGGPAIGLEVQLLQVTYNFGGGRSFHSTGRSTTNEQGEFRFPSVNSGRYYLVAGPRAGQVVFGPAPGGGSPNGLPETYALTYYPGVPNLPDATAIDLLPGQNLAAVDSTVYPQKTYTLRGSVIDSPTGRPPEAVRIELQYEIFAHEGISSPFNGSYDASNGKFEIHNVPSGSYIAEASFPDHNRPGSDILSLRASVAVIVANSDVDGVTLVAYPPASIQGRLTVDGQELSTIRDFARIRVGLESMRDSALSKQVAADGTFRIDNVVPGLYQVGVCLSLQNSESCARSTPDFYVKYAQFDRSDVLNTLLHFDGSVPTPLDIVLSPRPAQIEGTMIDEKQLPANGITAVLIPDQNRDRSDLYQFSTSDQDGHFAIKGIAPGSYKIFAWEALEEPMGFFDPDLMRRFEPYGTPARVAEGDQLKIDITVIPATK